MDVYNFVEGLLEFTEGEEAVVVKRVDFDRLMEWAKQFPADGRPNFDVLPFHLSRN